MSRLKQKIKSREKTVGTHVNLSDIAVGRIAGLAGFDFIWIDTEHGYMSYKETLGQITAVKSAGSDVIVRVPQDDLTSTKKVLEMGVDGIIFPMIRSAEEARRIIGNTLYPPEGTRGFGPMGAIDYGYRDAADYVMNDKDRLCRFIQIEHIDAVNDLEEICRIPYIDGFIFGPNDLSGSIGELLNVKGENTAALIKRSIEILKKNGKYIGISTGDTSPETLSYWSDLGIDMISAGADFGILVAGYSAAFKTIREVHLSE